MSEKNFDERVADAAKAMENPKKRSDNPFFKSKYADLSTTMDVIEPELEKAGLAHRFVFDGTKLVYAVFDPKTKEYVKSEFDIGILLTGLDGNVGQEMGKLITYFRRYISQAFWGLVPEDDDAQGAPTRNKPAARRSGASRKASTGTGSSIPDEGEDDDL